MESATDKLESIEQRSSFYVKIVSNIEQKNLQQFQR